jgi:deoxyhypusine synthase
MQQLLNEWGAEDVVCSWKINRRFGGYLLRHAKGRGILRSCVERKVPVFVPAFTDSELGIDFVLHKRLRKKQGRPLLRFDPYEDFEIALRRC